MSEQISTTFKIKVMSKYQTAAVESALNFNQITVSQAIEMGISEEALQQIENDKVNRAAALAERFENELGDINNL